MTAPDALMTVYIPSKADDLADKLLQSIAFKIYSADDDFIRDAATMLRRLAAQSEPRICPACNGEGLIEHPASPTWAGITAEAPADPIQVQCEDCDGTGKEIEQ